MSGVWRLEDSRLVAFKTTISAANADNLDVGYPGPSAGKMWVILGFGYKPSVAETQIISIGKYNLSSLMDFAVLNPVSLNLNPAVATLCEQGMEYLLLPGEYFVVRRQAHTAGSTMAASMEYIEIDQPLYTYEEPQIVKREKRAISSLRRVVGGSIGQGGPGTSPDSGGDRSGRGGPLPI